MLNKEEHRKNIKSFHKNLFEDMNKMREEQGLSLDDLAEQSHIPLAELCRLGCYRDKNWGTLFQLARFFDRKIKIMFY